MASGNEEEPEYESDPEEAKRSLSMRRREAASDDEEGDVDERGRDRVPVIPRAGIVSDGESDGQGAAAEYDDEEEFDGEEYQEEEEEEEEEEEVEIGGREEVEEEGEEAREDAVQEREHYQDTAASVGESNEVRGSGGDEQVEEKKDNEPYAVPTAGAFYMHDDRFRDNVGGRNRRTLGGRKLWESKDDGKWGHDKFEEMKMQEKNYEEGSRNSKGHYRGRGKNRIADRGYGRGGYRSKTYNNASNQNHVPKSVRGRGPRRYEAAKNYNGTPPQTKRSGKSLEKPSNASSGRVLAPTTNVEADPAPAKKQVFASSLSSASPPFYPSGSSNKDISQKRDLQAGSTNRNLRSSVLDESYSIPQSNAMLRGKNTVDSIGIEKLHVDDSMAPLSGKPLTNLQMQSSSPSLINVAQPPQPRAQGRGMAVPGQMTFQPTPAHNQANKVSSSAQLHPVHRTPIPGRFQPLQAASQQSSQRPNSGSQASSPPKAALSINSHEAETESSSESSKSKTALVGKGKGSIEGSGRGSFLYGGAQVIGATGNMAANHVDQNFPAFLPVMQFGGQHPGGIGVPAVGMAFPGYVAQPQLGLGNSEMTWLPVLAGAGALGATYCPPYIAVDGSYHARPLGQASSSSSSSKDNNTNKSSNDWKPSQRPDILRWTLDNNFIDKIELDE
ncbi:Btz domain [Dillenia turbinata]|uniref:Btz domain n=1 Tax=Dillenia turbinata TaxID=194707 RepID=A0AAN8URZ9_9MAGN